MNKNYFHICINKKISIKMSLEKNTEILER